MASRLLVLGAAILAAVDHRRRTGQGQYLDFSLGLPTVILGHVVYLLPFALVISGVQIAAFDPTLELAARDCGVPFYVCSESFKQSNKTVAEIELEAKDPAEIGLGSCRHVEPQNIYFDITPAQLVTGYISETGIEMAAQKSH